MAGDWLKMRTGLTEKPEFMELCRLTGLDREPALYVLYRLACWFAQIGKYSRIHGEPLIVDTFIGTHGVADALLCIGWMRSLNGHLSLHGFCVPAADRKSLGRVVRAEILTGASCRACASVGPLVIDHIVPIVRGGTSDRTNLQPLCDPCNRAKGRKTMSEFMSGRRQ